MKNYPDVFISYARADGEDFAHRLYDDLEADHINAWLDIYDIPPGTDWDAEIDKGLRSARAVVVILTPGAVLSRQVKGEWNDALNRNVPVIPLLAMDCQVPRVLNVLNYIDFRDDYNAGIAKLRQCLRNLDIDHLEHLKRLLAAFEVAQQDAPASHRFQPKIDDLRSMIKNWGQRVELQRERIAAGLEHERQRAIREDKRRRAQMRQRVVGQRPMDVMDYFKDRQREAKEIGQLLTKSSTHLISVIGRGGMGKTALACKVLRDLEYNRWPHTDDEIPVDGIVYLSTRTTGVSLERLFLNCAKMLGGEQEKTLNTIWTNPRMEIRDKIYQLLEALSDGLYVILMDNMEDILNDEGQIIDEDLHTFFDKSLTTPHGARLLITSRISLTFRREVMRFDRQVPLLEGLPTSDGVALLRELDTNGIYGLRDAPEEQLAKTVELVRGVPRALEVIGGILANDPFARLDDILERFFQQEDVVRDLIEENYRRLDGNARRAIEALAVFERPVPPLAVDYLLEPFAPGLDVPSILRRLTRTHIVSVDRASGTVALHPIDRDYAYSQLPEDETGESAYTRQGLERRAAQYYRSQRKTVTEWKSIDDLEPQLREFDHLVRAGDYDDAASLLDEIDLKYLLMWGHVRRLQMMREKLEKKIKSKQLQMNQANSLGFAYADLGLDDALFFFQQALTIAHDIDDLLSTGHILNNLSLHCRRTGRYAEAVNYCQQALDIARQTNNRREEGIALENLGSAYRRMGNCTAAIKYNEQALTIHREISNRQGEADARISLGLAYYNLGRMDEAIHHLQRGLDSAREVSFRRGEEYIIENLGVIHLSLGDLDKSIDYGQQSLAISRETGDQQGEGNSLSNLARVYRAKSELDTALEYAQASANLLSEIGMPQAKASRALVDAINAAIAGNKPDEARALLTCVQTWMNTGHLRKALETAEEARDIAQAQGLADTADEAQALINEINTKLALPEDVCRA